MKTSGSSHPHLSIYIWCFLQYHYNTHLLYDTFQFGGREIVLLKGYQCHVFSLIFQSNFWFPSTCLVIRLKCGEFLLLLIGHVNGRGRPPLATIHEDIRQLLGEKSASLIWAASQFGSTLDPEQRLTALHIQARRVLESLDLY